MKWNVKVKWGKGPDTVINPTLKSEIVTPNKKTLNKLVEDIIILNGMAVIVDIRYSNPLFLNLLSFYTYTLFRKVSCIPYSHPHLYLPPPTNLFLPFLTPSIWPFYLYLPLPNLIPYPTHIPHHIYITFPVPISSIPRRDPSSPQNIYWLVWNYKFPRNCNPWCKKLETQKNNPFFTTDVCYLSVVPRSFLGIPMFTP